MAAVKRPDFGGFTKRTVKKPVSMDDFLKNDSENDSVTQTEGKTVDAVAPETESGFQPDDPKKAESTEAVSENQQPEGQGAVRNNDQDEDSQKPALRLTYATTLNLDTNVMDDLEMLWIKLRRSAPVGKKKRISKSLLINLMISNAVKEINENMTDHPIVKAIQEMI